MAGDCGLLSRDAVNLSLLSHTACPTMLELVLRLNFSSSELVRLAFFFSKPELTLSRSLIPIPMRLLTFFSNSLFSRKFLDHDFTIGGAISSPTSVARPARSANAWSISRMDCGAQGIKKQDWGNDFPPVRTTFKNENQAWNGRKTKMMLIGMIVATIGIAGATQIHITISKLALLVGMRRRPRTQRARPS
ncbi:hypothetical protein BU16DRAFT_597609, partial [Lophium mytilinum]